MAFGRDSKISKALRAGLKRQNIDLSLISFIALRKREGPLCGIEGISGNWLVAPEPAHHTGEDGTALFLAVVADTPGIVHFVAFGFKGVFQTNILVEPVAFGFVDTITNGTVIIASVLHENADRFLLTDGDQFRVNIFAPDVGVTADKGDDLSEIIGAKPGHGKGSTASGA
jgi:hypothetical protein